MPKWWPWARSAPATPTEPSAPVAADRPPAAWQHLAPIQRTVGDIEPTAQFAGFAESLTTSANPAFTRPLALLTAEGLDGLPVLDTVRESVRADAPAPPPAPASRRWAPRLPSVQRARVGVSVPVQRLTEGGVPEAQAFPAEHAESTSTREMVEASDVDERRPLDAVPTDTVPTDAVAAIAADSPTDPPPSIGADPARPTPDTVEPVTVGQPAPPRAPTVQRTATGAEPSTTLPVVQTVSTPPRQTTAPALRHIATVQRMAGTGPLPTLRIVDVAAPPSPPHDADTSSPSVSLPDPGVPPLPASVPSSPAEPDMPDITVETLPGTAPAQDSVTPILPSPVRTPHHVQRDVSAAPQSASSPADVDIHVDTRADFAPTVPAVPSAQILPSPYPTSLLRPGSPPKPLPPVQRVERSSSAPALPDTALPVQRVDTAALAHPPSRTTPSVQTPQPAKQPARSLTFEPRPETEPDATVTATVAADAEVTASTAPTVHPDVHTPVTVVPDEPIRTPPAPTRTEPTQPVIAQRITLPVAETAAIARPATPIHPVVQRAAQNRRLVVLPPIRTDSEPPSNTVGTATTESTAVGSSPRPVGLQRMFAAAGSTTTPRAEIPSQPTPTESPINAHYFAAPDRFDREPAHHYDTATNTITFDTAHVQREPDESTPAPPPEAAPEPATEPAGPGVTAVAPVAAAAAPPPAGTNIDELLNKLYDPLVARLRAELWLDRERAGMLMDLPR